MRVNQMAAIVNAPNERTVRASHLLRNSVHAILMTSALVSVPKPAAAAPDPCSNVFGIVYCTGNQSEGIYNEWDRYLYVYGLTHQIRPAQGNIGIVLHRTNDSNPLTIFWDGSQSIWTDNAHSLYLRNFIEPFLNGRAGDVNVTTLGGEIITEGGGRYDSIFAESYGQESALDLPVSGGDVFVNNRSNIANNSFYGNGIFAHSWATYSGLGGNVNVVSNANVDIAGLSLAHAIWALSEGGYGANGSSGLGGSSGVPGGAGGNVLVQGSGRLSTSGMDSHAILAISRGGIGGSGGDGWVANAGNGVFGGSAGTVTVDGSWNIYTGYFNSSGIYAESLGGEGGQGGRGYTFGSGGDGGGSGNGSTVTVISRGNIFTGGDYSYGIFAHSVGGFAGGGGNSYGVVGYGGSGQSAGYGGEVHVTSLGNIDTRGWYSHGIVAQSIGGGGGGGGNGGGIVSVGGGGASGGNGNAVAVTNGGAITATGVGARGIFAQSIGGGGGDGGNAGAIVAVGGAGSGTSDGGTVTVDNSANIFSRSHAIYAESVGGGGGNGGSSTGWFAVGGGGGSGGNADAVIVRNHAALTTTEDNASAIFAHSVGGGGGNGGASVAAGAFGSVAIGGSGEHGGDGSTVYVLSDTGAITTGTIDATTGAVTGHGSSGIYAQSIGGGGGNGGFAFSGAIGVGVSAAIAVGGEADEGGDGQSVTVDNASSITTHGNDAHAIFAESIGGGGGNGGFAIAVSGSDSVALAAAVGGGGAGGGEANTVDVTTSGANLSTYGDRSYGVLAQSVGGGGGNGGFAVSVSASSGLGAALAVGGNGDTGGIARDVTVDSSSNITTRGVDSHGLFAQSLGGGGGSGGFSVAGSLSLGSTAQLALGGSGDGGGSSGNVTVGVDRATSGTIRTSGNNSYGLLAQSVGGGGGSGGFSVAGNVSMGSSATLALGGGSGGGGNSGIVTVRTGNDVYTGGNDSHGIFAQSLGGGGGNGGFAVSGSISVGGTNGNVGAAIGGDGAGGGSAQNVTVESSGTQIQTMGRRSYGLVAQSVGGGGGDGGFAVAGSITQGATATFAMGGNGDGGGMGRDVHVESSTSITTFGSESHGLFAQSLGGGGGSGGFAVAGSISAGAAINVSLGGDGAGGGSAGNVNVGTDRATTGAIRTSGDGAYGLLVQSVGGGGGSGGFSVAGSITQSASAQFSMGGGGSTGGNAGAVHVNTANTVVTGGNDAHGIFAQSLGGGGGNGGFSVAGSISTNSGSIGASLGGDGAGGGDAQTVDLTSRGAFVETSGNRSYGLVAQSVGGGGGDGGFSVGGSITNAPSATFSMGGSGDGGGIGRNVTVLSSTAITTRGNDAHGMFVQSIGGGGGSGGFSVAGSMAVDGAVNASVGGSGGSGGGAGRVVAGMSDDALTGDINTFGARSYGILAQSVGGGGGDGGFSVAGSISRGASGRFSLGGSGDEGADGQTVDVVSENSITTRGAESHAIFAQSVGGGGGSGGFSVAGGISTQNGSVGLSIGGSGEGGGNANNVTVSSANATLITGGERAHGIFAQSLGGGGGNGGFSVAGGINRTNSVQLSIGGFGDRGGNAGSVTVGSTSDITTLGADSHAIFAQSLGGGGGDGGFSIAGSLFSNDQANPAVNVSIGGFGDGGGNAGAVSVGTEDAHVEGTINTSGDRSYGIFAQSMGGGGGNGGFSVAGGFTKSPSVSLSLGGGGGTASHGNLVDVFTAADITTRGANAHAIMAQSLGGGGGNGGFSIAGSATTDVVAMSASIGGFGGGGGHGEHVKVTNDGTLMTFGDSAYGIFAGSIGGGGGSGGFSVAGSFSKPASRPAGPNATKNLDFSVGGQGGTGDAGGDVDVTNSGRIDTSGIGAHAIVAHSVGGGGGDGGFAAAGALSLGSGQQQSGSANISVSVGGFGGEGDIGGRVSVTNTNAIVTRGDESRGIYAYSVGGGGGDGGMATSIDVGLGASSRGGTVNLAVAVGGHGGDGDDGGNVIVDNQSTIDTYGDRSDGIYAHSVGGGGGDGGNARSFSLLLKQGGGSGGIDQPPNTSVQTAIGGFGGTANNGGEVTVTNTGAITTTGALSRGIVAQSIGGGGGSGGQGVKGFNNEAVDALTVLNKVKAMRDWSVLVGGDGGASGDGRAVEVTNSGRIETSGFASTAIFAQSVGGGGGEAQNFAEGTGDGGRAKTGLKAKAGIGGAGGAAGHGAAVDVTNSGELITHGDDAIGIFAQSIGGGGGVSGNVDRGFSSGSYGTPKLNVGIGFAFVRDGGGGGDGGNVTVTNTSNITTDGAGAYGIYAQSVAGGGGYAGGDGNDFIPGGGISQRLFSGSTGASGTAGTVTINQTGNITTWGENAHAIVAQSAAGEDFGRDVTISINGVIQALADDADGIFAHSQGDRGNGNISITIEGGGVRGGAEGAAVRFIDGANNTLVNRGVLGDATLLHLQTIAGGDHNETVDNYGTFAGTFDLGGGSNSFFNREQSLMISGATLNVGAGGTLTNSGTWSPGDVGVIANTTLNGNYSQTSTGRLLMDFDPAALTSDRVSVEGGEATLRGTVSINAITANPFTPGTTWTVLFTAPNAFDISALGLDLQDSAVTKYSLVHGSTPSGEAALMLQMITNFMPANTAALTHNQYEAARYLNAVQSAGGSAELYDTVLTIASLPTDAMLAQAYDMLTADSYIVAQAAPVYDSLRFSDAMLSCKQFDGEHRFVDEGECGWMNLATTDRREEASRKRLGANQKTQSVSGGLQRALTDRWHLGVGFSLDDTEINVGRDRTFSAVQHATGDGVQLGAVLKGNFGASTLSASLSAGHTEFEVRRGSFNGDGFTEATSIYATHALASHLRYGYAFEGRSAYLRPLVDVGYTRLRRDGFTEQRSGATNLSIAGETDELYTLQPALEFGGEVGLPSGAKMRGWARAGVTHLLSGGNIDVTARLESAPVSVAPMTFTQSLDTKSTDYAVGFDLLSVAGVTLRLMYSHSESDHTRTQTGSVKMSASF
ncbi:autotransporter outer membrane beta-barrel domain-containing protein [Steroidobacter cummioxidans]|uniref:autotransporter outer membrane beta-barrel domain-containing protein n=1 Tax=Steroidobacter cummioxidans TaxID=1803913 RepID=UPI000E30E795|nr:autotransporter outer membrane beta-barrel domain-containing protein [Steroidobacter cummioxidans]